MKKALVKSKLHSLKRSHNQDTVESQKLIVFGMGNVNLALPIDSVYKVVNKIPVYSSSFSGVGITHIGDREVTIVELHRRFFAPKGSYLIIAQNREGELYGIPVAQVPALMEIPQSSLRVLPESYRHADIFGFATHVAVIFEVEPSMTIFLLDVDQLLSSR